MKTKFPLRFALILTVFSFFSSLILEPSNSIIGAIIASFVTGIVSFFLLQLFLVFFIQKSLDDIISNVTNKNEDLIAYEPLNYSKICFINPIGGIGCLYKDKLVFIPHTMNLSKQEITIFFREIENISAYKIWGIFDTGLKVVLKSGKTEKFVIDKESQFYKRLLNIIRT